MSSVVKIVTVAVLVDIAVPDVSNIAPLDDGNGDEWVGIVLLVSVPVISGFAIVETVLNSVVTTSKIRLSGRVVMVPF